MLKGIMNGIFVKYAYFTLLSMFLVTADLKYKYSLRIIMHVPILLDFFYKAGARKPVACGNKLTANFVSTLY